MFLSQGILRQNNGARARAILGDRGVGQCVSPQESRPEPRRWHGPEDSTMGCRSL
jgi:hypothetical protein